MFQSPPDLLPELAPSFLETIDLGQRTPQPVDRAVEGVRGFGSDEFAIRDRGQHLQRVADVTRRSLSAVDPPSAIRTATAILLDGYGPAAPVAQTAVRSTAAL